MKQTFTTRLLAIARRCYQSWLQNWFSYTLLLIVLLAIWKKHQNQVQQLLRGKQVQESGLLTNTQQEVVQSVFTQDQMHQFVTRFERTARQEEKKFGIPARIILATSLVQSQSGTNQAAVSNHNYFALRNSQGIAKYASAWESFRAFSLSVNQALEQTTRPRTDQEWIAFLQERKLFVPVPQFEQSMKQALP